MRPIRHLRRRLVAGGAASLIALAGLPSAASAGQRDTNPRDGGRAGGVWLRPVPGDISRAFSVTRAAPFMSEAHRGVDLAAPPGTAVRAACRGVVIHAGPVAGTASVVSVRCGQ